MNLGKTQRKFSYLVSLLIGFIYNKGYEVTFGEAYRPEYTADYMRKTGKGISNSNHTRRLAIDLNLFKDDKFLTTTEDHKIFGEYWEKIGEENNVKTRWGGRFNDGNHYSIEWNGVI